MTNINVRNSFEYGDFGACHLTVVCRTSLYFGTCR